MATATATSQELRVRKSGKQAKRKAQKYDSIEGQRERENIGTQKERKKRKNGPTAKKKKGNEKKRKEKGREEKKNNNKNCRERENGEMSRRNFGRKSRGFTQPCKKYLFPGSREKGTRARIA